MTRPANTSENQRVIQAVQSWEPVVIVTSPEAAIRELYLRGGKNFGNQRSPESTGGSGLRVGLPQPDNTDANTVNSEQQRSSVGAVLEDGGMADGMEIARITIIRRLFDDDVVDELIALDNNGERLPVTESLGMLALAQDSVLHSPRGSR